MAVERIQVRISPDLLDTIGRSFNFSHGKGIAEWLKNSLDQYLRLHESGEETLSGSWPVLVNLLNANSRSAGPNLAVIDFGGTSFRHVEEFFLHWGDTSAATHGGASSGAALTGGHGNGGKFYMREMWRDGARLTTWRDGRGTSLVVEKANDGTTGYWERKNERMSWREALNLALDEGDNLGGSAWAVDYLEANTPDVIEELDEGRRGLTVIVGRRARQVRSSNDVVRGGRWDTQKLIDDIRNAPQARRPIRELSISVFEDGRLRLERLHLEAPEEDPDWEVESLELPVEVIQDEDLAVGASIAGVFTLRKAAEPLEGRSRHHNSIFVTDGHGNPIGSYPLQELPLGGHSSLTNFLFGELQLVFPRVERLVANDRERLVGSPTTGAILERVADYVWDRVREVENERRASARQSELEIAAALNKQLNQHAKRFLEALETEIMVDFVDDPVGGGVGQDEVGAGALGDTPGIGDGGNGSSGGGSGPERPGPGGRLDTPGRREVAGTAERVRRPKFPRVLLSGYDADPSRDDGGSRVLTDRHPPLYQEDVDKLYNVWWLNTEHPFASQAIRRGGAQGSWFKSHHLYMFAQMVQHEALRMLQRREPTLALDSVEAELMRVANNFLGQLSRDLVDALLGSREAS